jgi:hypothetical protein
MESDRTEDRLREIVSRHHVTYEVWPEYAVSDEGQTQKVGFHLELYGHHPPGSHPMAGCPLCQAIFTDLQEIAAWIQPKEKRDSVYEDLGFDASLHFGRESADPGSVMLDLRIVHRSGFSRPVNACEERCLHEMEERLKELGACREMAAGWQDLSPGLRGTKCHES